MLFDRFTSLTQEYANFAPDRKVSCAKAKKSFLAISIGVLSGRCSRTILLLSDGCFFRNKLGPPNMPKKSCIVKISSCAVTLAKISSTLPMYIEIGSLIFGRLSSLSDVFSSGYLNSNPYFSFRYVFQPAALLVGISVGVGVGSDG